MDLQLVLTDGDSTDIDNIEIFEQRSFSKIFFWLHLPSITYYNSHTIST